MDDDFPKIGELITHAAEFFYMTPRLDFTLPGSLDDWIEYYGGWVSSYTKQALYFCSCLLKS